MAGGARVDVLDAGAHSRFWTEQRDELRRRFVSCPPPSSPPNGAYRGELVLVTVPWPLGSIARVWTRRWMPWKGKRFFAESRRGDNRFSNDALGLVKLYWPSYRGVRPADRGHFTAFTFVTRFAPSVVNASQVVLRIDYDLDENPRLGIRDVVDEVVALPDGRLLGEAQVRFRRRWHTAAYFTLAFTDRIASYP